MESSRAEVESRVNCLWDYYTSRYLRLQYLIANIIAFCMIAQKLTGVFMRF